jgi:hypothetical protein
MQRRVAGAIGDVDVSLAIKLSPLHHTQTTHNMRARAHAKELDGLALLLEHGDVQRRATRLAALIEVNARLLQEVQL